MVGEQVPYGGAEAPIPIGDVVSGGAPQGQVLPAPAVPVQPITIQGQNAPNALPDPEDINAIPGGPPAGGIRATPQQAVAGHLNNLQRQQELTGEEGQVMSQQGKDLAAIRTQEAAEKAQQSLDFNNLLKANNDRYDAAHAQSQKAYEKYSAAAGSLEDPGKQFFKDSALGSVGGHIASAFAAFASGMGAGLTGHGGNPFLDYLNNRIKENFQAHSQNVEDLYKQNVAAGHIEDNLENHNKFMQQAKLASYDLASAHIKPQLERIAASTTGNVQRILAQKTIAQMDDQGITLRQTLSQQEAAQGAAALAQARARQKEMRDNWMKMYDLHTKDRSPEDAADAATAAMVKMGYNMSELAPILKANGYTANEKGEMVPPVRKKEEEMGDLGTEAHYDANGQLVVPTKDAQTGQLIPLKERQEMQKGMEERTVYLNGKPEVARSKTDAENFGKFNRAEMEARRLTAQMEQAIKDRERGSYDQAREALVELAPKLYEYTRGPSGAQAGTTGEGGGTVSGQIPEWSLYNKVSQLSGAPSVMTDVDMQKLGGWKKQLDSLRDDMYATTFKKHITVGEPDGVPGQATKAVEDWTTKAGKLGGKAL